MTQATLVRPTEADRVLTVWQERQGGTAPTTERLGREFATALAYCYLYDARPDLRPWLGAMRLAGWLTPTEMIGWDEPTGGATRWLAAVWRGEASSESRPEGLSEADGQVLAEALRLGELVSFAGVQPDPAQVEALKAAQVGLVIGGAVKIKEYVFESSGLPEVRGASTLLDYINLQMIPTLFGQLDPTKDEATYDRVKGYKTNLSLVPEALIYANGGEFLAFAPASQVQELALTVERFYAVETLTAQAIAVGETFSFYELSQGLNKEKDKSNGQLPTVLAGLEAQQSRKITANVTGETGAFSQVVGYLSLLRRRRQEFNLVMLRDGGEEYELRQLAAFETFPAGQRCDSCDRRLAVAVWPKSEDEDDTYYLCEPCVRKAVVGQRQRKEDTGKWYDRQKFSWQPPSLESWQDKFNTYLIKENSEAGAKYWGRVGESPRPARMARDLDEIGMAKTDDITAAGFVGVIYGDGNNMGGLLQQIRTPAQYRFFADQVFHSLTEAVNEGLAAKLLPQKEINPKTGKQTENWYHPFEILSIGGDDIYLFVPGWAALEVGLEIAKRVEEKLGKLKEFRPPALPKNSYVQRCASHGTPENTDQSAVSLSSGVLIANLATPVYFLNRMVEELLKTAKKKAAKLREKGYYGATLDFTALKSVTMVSDGLEKWRKNTLYRSARNNTELQLTERPYTLPEMEALLDTLGRLKGPGNESLRAELIQLQEQLGQGQRTGLVDYRYWLTRHQGQKVESDGEKRTKAQELREQFENWTTTAEATPWRTSKETRRVETKDKKGIKEEREFTIFSSIVGDLVELYDFVRPNEGKDGDI